MRNIKKLLLIIVIILVAYLVYDHYRSMHSDAPATQTSTNEQALANAFENHLSNIQVHGQGIITRVLPDDNEGSRHQRFIIRLASAQTLLIAHNIDIAPRITGLSEGDTIGFNGEYEWNIEGGIIHWTHRDPTGHHPAGWIKHNGKTFQ